MRSFRQRLFDYFVKLVIRRWRISLEGRININDFDVELSRKLDLLKGIDDL